MIVDPQSKLRTKVLEME